LRSRFWVERTAIAAAAVVLIATATWLVHGETLGYGFHYDDYAFLHPHPAGEVLGSFHGSWDRTGVMVAFYRPVTVVFSALRFELFGLNSVAHHATSLAMFALAAIMLAALLVRITHRAAPGGLAALFFVCHPAVPYSLSAWITNQMHLLQTLAVLGALLWWDAVRNRGIAWWIPLLAFAAVSFAIKEDGIMLLPAILVLHELRRLVVGDTSRHVPWAFAIACGVLLLGLVWLRSTLLGELGGYGRPTMARAWANVSGALYGVYRLVPADRPWQPAASLFATWLPILGLVTWRSISAAARWCLVSGMTIALLFSLPFVFAAKPEQVYMLALGFAVTLAGAAIALFDRVAAAPMGRLGPAVAAAVVAAALTALTLVSRDITRDFAPFGPIVLAHDEIVQSWASVPVEIREYLSRKREPDARARLSSNPVDALDVVTYGTHGRDVTPDGVPYMWMNGTGVEMYVAGTARRVTIPLRHAIEAFGQPAQARIAIDGRLADELTLTTSEWRRSSTALRSQDVPAFSRMHRLRITIDRAWRPTEIIPGSTDGRLLGLQIGTAEVR
jgi:hypothetical protein